MKKKGVSLMVAYTILVVIGIALGAATYSYLKLYLPSIRAECPADIKVSVEEVICDSTEDELTVSILNRGLFNVPAIFVRFGEEERRVRKQLNDDEEILSSPLMPNDTMKTFVYNLTRIFDDVIEGRYILEVQPAILVDRVIVPCDEAIVSVPVQCADEGGESTCGNNRKEEGEECDGSDLDEKSCTDFGFEEGELRCVDCHFDTSQCGNGGGGCEPKDCADYGNPECGSFDDGCGGTTGSCGTCGSEGEEYCDNNGTYGECRRFLSCADSYGDDEGDWYNNNVDFWPLGVYQGATCTVTYQKNGNDITKYYDDWCNDARNLTQYHCVEKSDEYGKEYETCEKLDDVFNGDNGYFDCFNYDGPHCLKDGAPVTCYDGDDSCDYNPPYICEEESGECDPNTYYGAVCFCELEDGNYCVLPPGDGDTRNDGVGDSCFTGCQG